MAHHVYSVARRQDGWTVEHMGKLLEVHTSQEAAQAHVDGLRKLTQSGGRCAEVVIKDAAGEVESDRVYKKVRR